MKKNLNVTDSSLYINATNIWQLFDTDEGFRNAFSPLVRDAHFISCLIEVTGNMGCNPSRYCECRERLKNLINGCIYPNGRKRLAFKDRAIRMNDRNGHMVLSRFIKSDMDVLGLIEDLNELYEEMKDDARFQAALSHWKK